MTDSGYTIGRDDSGLTARERQMVDALARGLTPTQAGAEMGVSKQRAHALVRSLLAKRKIKPITRYEVRK